MDFTGITIGVLNSRKGILTDYCLYVLSQRLIYDETKIELIIEDNLDKKKSIGEGFNNIVKKAKFDWILFVGDDDYITRVYPMNLHFFLQTYLEKPKAKIPVAVTTNMLLCQKDKKIGIDACPTGMWSKQFLLENPFDETLERYVDTEMYARVNELGRNIIYDRTNHGYYYVQHGDNVSGNKFKDKTRVLYEIRKREKQNAKFVK